MKWLRNWYRNTFHPAEVLAVQWLKGDRFELRKSLDQAGDCTYIWHGEDGNPVSAVHRSEDVARVKFGAFEENTNA